MGDSPRQRRFAATDKGEEAGSSVDIKSEIESDSPRQRGLAATDKGEASEGVIELVSNQASEGEANGCVIQLASATAVAMPGQMGRNLICQEQLQWPIVNLLKWHMQHWQRVPRESSLLFKEDGAVIITGVASDKAEAVVEVASTEVVASTEGVIELAS